MFARRSPYSLWCLCLRGHFWDFCARKNDSFRPEKSGPFFVSIFGEFKRGKFWAVFDFETENFSRARLGSVVCDWVVCDMKELWILNASQMWRFCGFERESKMKDLWILTSVQKWRNCGFWTRVKNAVFVNFERESKWDFEHSSKVNFWTLVNLNASQKFLTKIQKQFVNI